MKTIGKLFLLFTIVTTVELFLLLKLAEVTSWWLTAATIIVPGLAGAWLAKREGARAFKNVREALSLMREPTGPLLDGVIVLVASAFLISPGVLTDLTGLALLIPPVRRVARIYLQRRIKRAIDQRLDSGTLRAFSIGSAGGFAGATRPDLRGYDVIDADDIPPRR